MCKAIKKVDNHVKPEADKTHLHNMIVVHEMIGSIVCIYLSKTFNWMEIKCEMIDH